MNNLKCCEIIKNCHISNIETAMESFHCIFLSFTEKNLHLEKILKIRQFQNGLKENNVLHR